MVKFVLTCSRWSTAPYNRGRPWMSGSRRPGSSRQQDFCSTSGPWCGWAQTLGVEADLTPCIWGHIKSTHTLRVGGHVLSERTAAPETPQLFITAQVSPWIKTSSAPQLRIGPACLMWWSAWDSPSLTSSPAGLWTEWAAAGCPQRKKVSSSLGATGPGSEGECTSGSSSSVGCRPPLCLSWPLLAVGGFLTAAHSPQDDTWFPLYLCDEALFPLVVL